MKLELKSFIIGLLVAVVFILTTGMSEKKTEVGQYIGWGDASNSRYMLDTSNGQLYLWHSNGWKKQESKIHH